MAIIIEKPNAIEMALDAEKGTYLRIPFEGGKPIGCKIVYEGLETTDKGELSDANKPSQVTIKGMGKIFDKMGSHPHDFVELAEAVEKKTAGTKPKRKNEG